MLTACCPRPLQIGADLSESHRGANFTEASSEDMRNVFGAILQLGRQNGATRIGGWLPDQAAVRDCFPLEQREREVAMIKSLIPGCRFNKTTIQSAQHFCEIDHI